jgi:hypothetical protein
MRFLLMLVLAGLLHLMSLSAFAAGTFTLSTNAFADKGTLPVLYTCDGKDPSPQLSWSNPPNNTAAFALLLSDPDAPGGTFYHWVIFNIPATVTTLPEGMKAAPTGTIIGMNDWQKAQYNGPCPPKGSLHNYIFTLYALDTVLKLPANADAKAVLDAMQTHIIATASLTAAYSRGQG